jgi:hypothetical protein
VEAVMGGARSGGDRVANGSDTFPMDGLPSRPAKFSKQENEYWTALLGQIPNDLLRRVDTHQLRTLCECMALRDMYYELVKEDPLDKTTYSHYMRAVQQIQRLSPVFGLGPLDRRRMKLDVVDNTDDADEWSDS